jgi:phosphoenolpyruvate synthase/pyruvate phosphate dikinase
MSGYTRTLSELRRADEPAFGGKSAGLGELLAAGLRVPAGFALACSAYRLARRDPPMPELVREEIARRYAELGETVGAPSPPVAVRSSAVGEDSAQATFAGQQESVLWVSGSDAVCDAVRTCWASLHSPTAVAYRARLGSSHADPTIGVTVQSMVEAEVAGVLFTCNPLSGDPSVVAINASWGLGVAVAGGEVTPDDYLVSKVTGEVLRERLGTKAVEYVRDRSGAGTARLEVAPERRGARTLDEATIAELVDIARAVERHFGAPQDVEWAIGADGLFVLQSRPVTALPEHRRAAEPASALSLVMKTFGARE